jgi:hypothetical protein
MFPGDPIASNGYTVSQNIAAAIVAAMYGLTNLDDVLAKLFPGQKYRGSPELNVPFDKHPSFNNPPKEEDSTATAESGKQKPPPDTPDFHIGYEALGSQVDSMLKTARDLVAKYEDLRKMVKDGEDTVFGQKSLADKGGIRYEQDPLDDGGAFYNEDPKPTVFAKPAQEFAAGMNPVQEKGLQYIGGALEVLGEYIALVNHSGQVYADADRKSEFGPPPDRGVRG